VSPLSLAEIVAVTVVLTDLVAMEKEATVEPAGTVMDLGTVAEGELLDSSITSPDAGAGLLRVIVPVESPPPVNSLGLRETDSTVGGFNVKWVETDLPARLAVSDTVVALSTDAVEATKSAEVWPAATVTLAGTVTSELPLLSETANPPGPAGPLNVTVPKHPAPPATIEGDMAIDARIAGTTVNFTDFDVLPDPAVSVTRVGLRTPDVVTVKVAEVAPWSMRTA
jgi:hypothetical protein